MNKFEEVFRVVGVGVFVTAKNPDVLFSSKKEG